MAVGNAFCSYREDPYLRFLQFPLVHSNIRNQLTNHKRIAEPDTHICITVVRVDSVGTIQEVLHSSSAIKQPFKLL